MRSQGVTDELVRLVARDIGNMGHMRAVVKNDNEPSMRALARGRKRDDDEDVDELVEYGLDD